MSVRHLQAGSTCPPLKPGVLRLYSMAYCPFAQRTRLALAHKNIKYELVNVNLKNKPEWLLEKNALGLIPILEKDGKIVDDSAICNEYLDEVYQENKLISNDPYEKAQMMMLIQRGETMKNACLALQFRKEYEGQQEKLFKGLAVLEELLVGDFFGGDKINMADISFFPFFEKFSYIKEFKGFDPLPEGKFPKLASWLERISQTRTAREAGTPLKYIPDILEAYKNNFPPNYDAALEQ